MHGAAFGGRRGETNLIVDNDVDRPADAVAGQLAQVQGFLDDAFAGETGVAVNQQRHARAAVGDRPGRLETVLLGAHAAQGHRVDEFQVAGIETERQMDRAARWPWSNRCCSPGDI